MVREYHKLSIPTPGLPSDPPQQEVRGPAVGGEVGSQWEKPSQLPFSSTDVRKRRKEEVQEQMSVSTIVGHLNKFCWQKPGGNFCLPKVSNSVFCLLCNQGCTCLGSSCKGPKNPTDKYHIRKLIHQSASVIPGLEGGPPSSVLTTPVFTSTKKIGISAISQGSFIFNWNSTKHISPVPDKSTRTSPIHLKKLPAKKNLKVEKTWYDTISYQTKKKLLSLLLKSSLNSNKTCRKQAENFNSNDQTKDIFCHSSISRKLRTSESRCIKNKKISISSPLSSSSSSTVSSSSTQCSNSPLSQHISSSSFSSPHFFSSPTCQPTNFQPDNFCFSNNQVIDYLKTEWDKVKDTAEIFNIEAIENGPDYSVNSSPLPPCEILRMSPSPPSHKRRQSPSPDSQQQRCHTPLKQKSPGTPPRGHTPRKDTPVKKKLQRFQCRNSGCRVYLVNVKSREKHETRTCKFRTGTEQELTIETEFNVPSHLDLSLDPLQCRVCLKKYGHERARKKHEQDKHRIFEIQGRTISPVRLFHSDSSPEISLPSRPQSCPPVETHSRFVTPERPCKRRRTLSSSTNPDFLESLDSSPLSSPHLTLTPNQQFSSMESVGEFESSAEVLNLDYSLQCSFCLVSFRNKKSQYYHKCNFRPDPHYFERHSIIPAILTRPKNWEQTVKILSQLCKEDVVELCRLQNWCLPGIYPLVFPHQFRSGRLGYIPVLDMMTASKASSGLLKCMVEMHGKFKIPKHIILRDEESKKTAYLAPNVLAPTSEFLFTEQLDGFIVTETEATSANILDVPEEPSDKAFSDESFGSDDDDDVLYCHQGLAPSPRSGHEDWSDTSLNQLPTPPYTRMTSHEQENLSPASSSHCNPGMSYGGDGDGVDGGGDDGGGDGGGDGASDGESDGDENNNIGQDQNENSLLSQDILNLLPKDFQPGSDGMGASTLKQMQAASYFRQPWKYSDTEIQNLVKLTKKQFFNIVLTCIGAHQRSSCLNIFAQCFLLLFKLCHNDSFYQIATLFGLKSHQDASNVFYRQLTHQYLTNCNIPAIIANGNPNQEEVDKLLENAYFRTPLFFKGLMKDFHDPSGMNRTPVILNIDGTYFDIQGSADFQLQKYMYYLPRAGHVAKWINLTDLGPKFVGFLPIASSQSPSSGDGLLLAKHIELEDMMGAGLYIRTILRGNNDYFVILICDAGFVVTVPNAPIEARGPDAVTLASVCLQEHCVLLHTSNKHERYHLKRTDEGKIKKVPWTPGNPSLEENTVKLTRMLRKCQEQIHAALKSKFKILDMRHLCNEYLLPLNARQIAWFGLPPEYRDIPRLNILATVCCSLLNSNHPGFYPLYMDPLQQVRAARLFTKRIFLKNPLLHPDIWPINFTTFTGAVWKQLTFGSLDENDVLDFPKLDRDSINPTALELTSGPHAIEKADSVLTYMGQILLKGQDLTRDQTARALENFPNAWKLYFTEIKAPADFQPSINCPIWIPQWWDQEQFGPWHDLKLVRCKIPPSYKSATSPANYHTVVIAYGAEPSDRLGLRPPYDRIYFSHCFKCPSLNGTVSMDRHLAAFLKALSFKHLYRSTAKTVNVLNTVADTRRQTTQVLPPTRHSADIPVIIERRGRNRRLNRAGLLDPLYNLDYSSVPAPPVPAQSAPTAAVRPAAPPSAPAGPALPVPDQSPPSESAGPAHQPASHVSATSLPPSPSFFSSNQEDENNQDLPAFESSYRDARQEAQEQNMQESVPTISESSDHARPAASRRRTARRGGLSPTDLLQRYLSDFDPNNIYPIPEASPNTEEGFTLDHLQKVGILNDGNVCSLISVILCFHRLGLKEHLIDPHFCVTLSRTPDFPSWVFMKILSAMPSLQSFSLQLFIESWNHSNKSPRIDPGFADIPSLAEGLVTNLQLKQYANKPPVFTQFLATFKCNQCGKDHVKIKNWEDQVQAAIPLLQLPVSNQPVNIMQLLKAYVQEPFQTRCGNLGCRTRIVNAMLEVQLGFFTIVAVNRFQLGGGQTTTKLLNKLQIENDDDMLDVGELVSVVCHRGDVNYGHFVSYHKVGQQWFQNDDSRKSTPSNNPLEQTNAENETVDLLFFKK